MGFVGINTEPELPEEPPPPPPPEPTDTFPLWPNGQADFSISGSLNAPGNLLNSPWKDEFGKMDVAVFQGLVYRSNKANGLSQHAAALDYITSNYPRSRMYIYNQFDHATREPTSFSKKGDENYIIDGPDGNSNWWLYTPTGEISESKFSPAANYGTNRTLAALGGGALNNKGQNYFQARAAFYEDLYTDPAGVNSLIVPDASVEDRRLSGIFYDLAQCIPNEAYKNNGDSTTPVDPDRDGDSDDRLGDYYGALYRNGLLAMVQEDQAWFPDYWTHLFNSANDPIDNQNGRAPLPIDESEFYRQFELRLGEFQGRRSGVEADRSTSNFYSARLNTLGPSGNNDWITWLHYVREQTMTSAEATHFPEGVCVVETVRLAGTTNVDPATPVSADLLHFDHVWALCMLDGGGMIPAWIYGSGARRYPVKAITTYFDIGAPQFTRGLGTIDNDTGRGTWTFDTSSGFLFGEFVNDDDQHWLVYDNVNPITGGWQNWPTGQTDTVQLRDPPDGMVWVYPKAETYECPVTSWGTLPEWGYWQYDGREASAEFADDGIERYLGGVLKASATNMFPADGFLLQGDFSEGGLLTVRKPVGGLPETMPNIELFDRFAGAAGDPQNATPDIGNDWDAANGTITIRNRKMPNGYGLTVLSAGQVNISRYVLSSTYKELFVNMVMEFEGSAEFTNGKVFWSFLGANGYTSDDNPDFWWPSINIGRQYIIGSNTSAGPQDVDGGNDWDTMDMDVPANWNWWLQGSATEDGVMEVVNQNDGTHISRDYPANLSQASWWAGSVTMNEGIDRFNVMGFGSGGGSEDNIYIGHLYVAAGDNSAVRIELTDNRVYANATRRALCIMQSAEDDHWSATVRTGNFARNDLVHIWLFSKKNIATYAGYGVLL